jgi:hypothetical protein
LSILVFEEGTRSRPLYRYNGRFPDLTREIKIPILEPLNVGPDAPAGPEWIPAPVVTLYLGYRLEPLSSRPRVVGWIRPVDVFLLGKTSPVAFPPCLVRL